MHKD
jgi:GTP-binding protein